MKHTYSIHSAPIRPRPLHLAVLAVLAISSSLLFSLSAQAQQTQWTIAPYAWMPDVTVRGDINEKDVIDRTKDFEAIVDDVDFVVMGFGEVRHDRVGAFVDAAFVNLGGQQATVHVAPTNVIAVPQSVQSDMKLTNIDGVVFFRPGGGDEGFDIYGGVRMVDFDQKLDVIYPNNVTSRPLQVDETLYNGIVGVRFRRHIAEAWDLALRVDGGAGGAEFTWLGQATAGYWFGDAKNMSVQFGYRYMELKFEKDVETVNIDTKLEMSGPIAGFVYRF